ncbi:MAG: tetratricopeptide repeat protein [Acidobacteriota bacterium]
MPPLSRRPLAGLLIALCVAGTAASASAQDAAAARLFNEAERLADSGDIRAALGEYQLLDRQFPNDRLASAALLASARIQRALGEERGARDAIDKLLTEHPRTLEAASAFVLQGDLAFDRARGREELSQALTSYRRVPLLFSVEGYPNLPARARALVRHGEISLLLGDRESALADFVAVAEDEPASPDAWRGRRLLGRTLLESGQTAAALETLQRLIDHAEAPDAEKDAARRLNSLAHRLILRPSNGESPWQNAERYAPANLKIEKAQGIAASEDGQLLVLDAGDDRLIKILTAGDTWQSQVVKDAVRPGWGGGRGSVAFVVTEEKLRLPFDGQSVGFLEPKSGREKPLDDLRAAVRGPLGDWFLIAKGWKGLLAYQTPRRGEELLGTLRSELVDLEYDAAGRVYALDRREKRVLRLAVDRRSHEVVVQGDWRRPEALALDSLGNIYVLDRGERRVSVFGPSGRRIAALGPTLPGGLELKRPRDLSVDGSGRLWIADEDLPFLVSLQ